MAPGLESGSDIRSESEDHQSHKSGRSYDERQFGEVAASEEGDDEEGDEEYHRRTEISHYGEASQAEYREAHENRQVFTLLEFIQRSRANVNEYYLHQFRGLERESADLHPVLSSIANSPQQQVYQQQKYAGPHKGVDYPLGSVEITQEPA